MRRGRLFIYLAIIVVLAIVVVVAFVLRSGGISSRPQVTTTPQGLTVEIVVAGQAIYPGTPISKGMLTTYEIPQEMRAAGEFTSMSDLEGLFAKFQIPQGVIITSSMVTSTPGIVSLPGSLWAQYIPLGLTATSVPISRLSTAAFSVRDGDFVNIIVTMLLVDIDSDYQTVLPNVISPFSTGADALTQGRMEFDSAMNQGLYIAPSESQRPRMVSQMILQNVQVLHVGTFPLPGEPMPESLVPSTSGSSSSQSQSEQTIQQPDIITLMVAPQDAVTLTYLVHSGARISLTLRNPNDQELTPLLQSATLDYLLTQYNITIPGKVPYATSPRVDTLVP